MFAICSAAKLPASPAAIPFITGPPGVCA